ncbi:hypothetical protein [Haloarcula marina]|uniref:hypothetical protein n=1 Tax=Haloarcula marina TaxID=2961574 RepID=UPI0020B81C6E|nr:hypothetical protein [Halomicroarcula marina]
MTERNLTRRRVLQYGAVASGLAVGGSALAAQQTPGDGDCSLTAAADGSGDYADLQAAVDAASDGETVCVAPGEYDGTVVVDTPNVTLAATEPEAATVTGSETPADPAIRVAADSVALTGLTVRNSDGALGVSVDADATDVTLRNNRIVGVGPVAGSATAIRAAGGNAGLTVSGNTVESVASEFGEEAADGPTATGIALGEAGAGGHADVTVENNAVRAVQSEAGAVGLAFGGTLDGASVQGNRVTGLAGRNDRSESEQAAPFETYARGLVVDADRTAEVTVEWNVFEDITAEYYNGESARFESGAGGVTLRLNNFLTVVGVHNRTETAVAGSCNYWGSRDGPRQVDSNRAADDELPETDRAAIVGPMTFRPWLLHSVETGEMAAESCHGGR